MNFESPPKAEKERLRKEQADLQKDLNTGALQGLGFRA